MNEAEIKRIAAEAGCRYDIHCVDETGSTNTELKRLAAEGAPDGYVLIAGRQTAGRGRMGHSFFSPGSGVYLSVLLRPDALPCEALHLTAAAGVSVCLAAEKLTDRKAQIKWVNDIYIEGKKVCGILTEASVAGGRTEWTVTGIGVNITEPEGGFPEEIRNRACALFPAGEKAPEGFRERFAAELLCAFAKQISLPWELTLAEYRRRSYLTGRTVRLTDGSEGTVCGISDDGSLEVRLTNGVLRTVSSQFSVMEG